MAWRIDGIGNTYRHAAKAAAERAGLGLGQWLDRTILGHPSGPTREDADAEITRALAALETRVEQSSRKLDEMLRPLQAEVERLAGESEQLHHRNDTGLARAEQELNRQMKRLEGLAQGGPRPQSPDDAAAAEGREAPTRGPYRPLQAPDPEESNHDPWTRHHPHGAPRLHDLPSLKRRRLIRIAGGIGAVGLIVTSIAAGVWVVQEHANTSPAPTIADQPGLTTPSADQTPPRVIAEIAPKEPVPGTTGVTGTTGDAAGHTAAPKAVIPLQSPATLPSSPAGLAALRARAEARDVQAEYLLGLALLEGKGASPSPREGSEWISTAAVAGHAQAQFLLGRLYGEGKPGTGLSRDPAQAFFWIQSAAEQGITEAEYELGMIYSQGNGVERSHALAARWFRQAGEKGHAPALYQLGLIYELGLDFRANRGRAIEWYRKAAAAGSRAAGDKLAQLGTTAEAPKSPVPSPAPTAAQSAPAKTAAPKAPAAKTPAAKPAGPTRVEIAEIQRLLKSLDFDPGLADGRTSAKTTEAIRQFQTMSGTPADGKLSRDLLGQLREITGGKR